ncbi:MAG: response regulator transcription factor [Bacteroidetes bacterium]|nr:MAG: response regulator transcription factor [Bacteroidota bacterium]
MKKELKAKIILVEDDVNLGFLLVDFLESNGFEVKLYRDGLSGLNGFQSHSFDFCILDLMLPRMDGFTLAEKIKELNSEIPVIILSARSFKEDKIKGFRIGVDDYITKPFDEEELLYRIRAIMNRIKQGSGTGSNGSLIKIGKFEFDCLNQILHFDNKQRRLTLKESRILQLLGNSKNNLVKREEIMIDVWGESDYYTGRSLDVFISKIRGYLKDDPTISIITIPTVGYTLEIKNQI